MPWLRFAIDTIPVRGIPAQIKFKHVYVDKFAPLFYLLNSVGSWYGLLIMVVGCVGGDFSQTPMVITDQVVIMTTFCNTYKSRSTTVSYIKSCLAQFNLD